MNSLASFVLPVFTAAFMGSVPGLEAGGCGCPPLWTAYDQSCYRFFTQNLTWAHAEVFCRGFTMPYGAAGSGDVSIGHLVSIHSPEEMAILTALYDSARTKRSWSGMWIGLHDISTEGEYEWTDGSPLNFTFWGLNQPTTGPTGQREDCVVFSTGDYYRWHDTNCASNSFESFICKLPQWETPSIN